MAMQQRLPLLATQLPSYGARFVHNGPAPNDEKIDKTASRSFFARLQALRGKYTADDEAEAADVGGGEKKVDIWRLLSVARPERALIGLAMGTQVVSSGSQMLFPLALGRIVDAVQNPLGATLNLDTLVLGMGAIFTVGSLATGLRVSTLSVAGSRISRELRKKLFESILRQETAFFDRRQSGELVNRLSSDVFAVSRTLTENLAKLVRGGITCATSTSLVLYLSPKLSLVALGAFPPIALFAYVFGRNARKLSRELVDALAAATQVAAERISAIRTVRVFGAEGVEAERYARRVDETYDLSRKVAVADGLYAGSLFYAAQVSLLGVLWCGGHMVANPVDPMTVGTLTSFSMYAVNLLVSLSSIGSAYGQLSRALGAGHRLFEVIDREPESRSSTLAPPMKVDDEIAADLKGLPIEPQKNAFRTLNDGYDATVKFDSVHFHYPTQLDAPVLKDASLAVHPGEICAVAGTSGSGKSTLASLLLRLYEARNGTVSLGGVSVSDLDAAWLRRQIAMVPQEPVLFNGTVADNIRYALDKKTPLADIERAARLAASHDMIMSLPNGYETIVGERGESLSGGQRARVALCRALVRNPRVLVLDEHSAALDAESERAVGNAVTNAARDMNMSVLIIAHRLSSLRRANKVCFLSAGSIAEEGRFDELLARPESMLRGMVFASENDEYEDAQG